MNTLRAKLAELDLDAVSPRAADLFNLKIDNLVRLAAAIGAVGQLSPIIVDSHHRLIAGRHRLHALRLLACPPGERQAMLKQLATDGARGLTGPLSDAAVSLEHTPEIRVRAEVVTFNADEEPLRAAEVEIQENTQRQSVSAIEVRSAYDRLRTLPGFADRRKPRKGEVAIVNYLGTLFGKSVKQITRDLDAESSPPRPDHPQKKPFRALLNARAQLVKELPGGDDWSVSGLLNDPRWDAVTAFFQSLDASEDEAAPPSSAADSADVSDPPGTPAE